ncbi:type II secretion system GspH family protein [bacterium]|nr:type II secretion system GspH family protein [bacterium]
MQKSSRAFTMIEMIFVIVILGILSAVAIPMFSATRNDAKVSKMAMDIGTIAIDISAYAVANANTTTDLSLMSSAMNSLVNMGEADISTPRTAIIKIDNVDCISMSIESNATNEDLNVSLISSTNDLCLKLQNRIDETNYEIRLRGTSIVY